jgi:hypothetical protein
VFTDDCGWTWVSEWEWGWAPFHYGRWYCHAHHGWVWIPGTVWGPAWVAWRCGDGFVGWAPLSPRIGWRVGVGLAITDVEVAAIEPHCWCFVGERFVLERRLHTFIVPVARNVTIVNVTKNTTNVTVVNNRVVNRSLDVGRIETVTGRTVPRFKIVERRSAKETRGVVGANQLAVFRPTPVQRPSREAARAPAPGKAATPVPKPAAGATSPPAFKPAPELPKRQESEQRLWEQFRAAKRSELETLHKEELSHPPSGVSPEELRRRHEAELRAWEAEASREKQVLEHWHEREKRGEARGGIPRQKFGFERR